MAQIASVELTCDMSTLLVLAEPGRLAKTSRADCIKTTRRALAALSHPIQPTEGKSSIERRKKNDDGDRTGSSPPVSPPECHSLPFAGLNAAESKLDAEMNTLLSTLQAIERKEAGGGAGGAGASASAKLSAEDRRMVEQHLKTIGTCWASSFAPHRPTNVNRTLFHIFSGVGVVFLFLTLNWVGRLLAATVPCAAAWTVEFFRRRDTAGVINHYFQFAAGIVHPHEWAHVTSSTFFTTAIAILVICLPTLEDFFIPAMLTLAFADPAAGIVGRQFGTIKIVGRKSLQGCTAFFIVAFTACFFGLSVYAKEVPSSQFVLYSAVAAAAGTVAELLPIFDDNLNIPVAVAFTMRAAQRSLERTS